MENGTGNSTATVSRPTAFDEIKRLAEQHIAIHPALDNVIDSLLELAAVQANGDKAGTILSALAGDCAGGGTVLDLVGYIIEHLGNPATNRALTTDVPAERLYRIQESTAEFTDYARLYLPHDLVNESVWDLNPTTI